MNKDEKEIRTVVEKFYNIISGKSGERRDWESFSNLFFPGARLIPYSINKRGECTTISYNINGYTERLDSYFEQNDFFESGEVQNIEMHKNIAHINSSYTAKTNPNDNIFLKKGKNFIQMLYDGANWKIVSMLWEDYQNNTLVK